MNMTKPRGLITEANEEEASYLTQNLQNVIEVQAVADTLADTKIEHLKEIEVLIPFIHTKVGPAELEAMPKLRFIATRSTGYDHIDLAAAKERGIIVANVPGYGETAVAEFTFALMLTLSRKVHQAYARTQRGDYTLEGLRGFDLYHKTLGVVGAGAIGLHVIRIATGFGMNVLAYDVMQNRLLSEVLGFRYVPLNELLSQSDIVTLHAPAIAPTYHMLNKETFAHLKRGAYLINTARGSLIDTTALAWALDTGILAGAALDATEGEEFLQHEEELLSEANAEEKLKLLVRNQVLQRRSNVIITPHIAFDSEEALRRIQDTTIENVKAFLAQAPANIVKA
jgi:D-lactate dehydrogenase